MAHSLLEHELRFPPGWSTPDAGDSCSAPPATAAIDDVVNTYTWVESLDSLDGQAPVKAANLRVIHAYVAHHGEQRVWEHICTGGVQGYSLYLHELVELHGFESEHLNPWHTRLDAGITEAWRRFHARALFVVHRLVQRVASLQGFGELSLAELISANPVTDEFGADKDWAAVSEFYATQLSEFDRRLEMTHLADDFYLVSGFIE